MHSLARRAVVFGGANHLATWENGDGAFGRPRLLGVTVASVVDGWEGGERGGLGKWAFPLAVPLLGVRTCVRAVE